MPEGVTAPYSFGEARAAAQKASAAQRQAEDFLRDTSRGAAQAEESYRVALAKRIVEAHAGGTAWTACQDIARGDPQVARLRFERDVAEGVKEAAQQAAWRLTADRKDLQALIDWSKRRELAENGNWDAS